MSSLTREIRAWWRLFNLGLVLARGFLTVRFCFPRWDAAKRRIVKQAWSRTLVTTLGVQLPSEGVALPENTLIVCNHISWLDIFVINALSQTHFVCKDDVRGWPMIGWLVEHTETVFIERGSRAAAARTTRTITERLARGERVAIFPEGTTTNGTVMLPFRAALFQAGIEAQARIAPVALRYTDHTGRPSIAPAYDGDISFWDCLRSIVSASSLRVDTEFLPLLPEGLERRDLAMRAERLIAEALDLATLPEGVAIEASPISSEDAPNADHSAEVLSKT